MPSRKTLRNWLFWLSASFCFWLGMWIAARFNTQLHVDDPTMLPLESRLLIAWEAGLCAATIIVGVPLFFTVIAYIVRRVFDAIFKEELEEESEEAEEPERKPDPQEPSIRSVRELVAARRADLSVRSRR